jgi:hypothetical protein
VYLEVAIYNADTSSWETLSPRQRLTSTAYAFQTENAQTLEGQGSAAFAPAEHQHSGGDINSGTVDETHIDSDIARDSEISWGNLSGIPSDIADGDQVGITTETDPTITDPSVKDGVSWFELSDIPAGFADGVDHNSGGDITGVTAGTGLSGGGASGSVTLNVDVPLALAGSDAEGVVSATNNYAAGGYGVYGFASATTGSNSGVYGRTASTSGKGVYGYATATSGTTYGLRGDCVSASGRGVYGLAAATSGETSGVYGLSSSSKGRGVYGEASNTGDFSNYGGYFSAAGKYGRGVYGEASNTGDFSNYGGYFKAEGSRGKGVYGMALNEGDDINYGGYFSAAGKGGRGVHGEASNTGDVENYGGYFSAAGKYGMGVYGEALNEGDDINYGGYFSAAGIYGRGVEGWATGSYGRGVHGEARGSDGRGVVGVASGSDGRGVHGTAINFGNVENYGGYFNASGEKGRGVYGQTSGDNGIGVWGKATGINSTGVWGDGGKWDFYAAGPGTNYGPFTGAHEVLFAEEMAGEIQPGMIVSVTGRVEVRKKENGEISFSSTLPTVTLAKKAMDKAVLGVLVSEGPFHEHHWYEAQEGERFGVVNALGEGRVLVTNVNGKIEAGDYITTSAIPGHGQKQDDDLLHSYTLGKAIETVDWASVTEAIEYNGMLYKVYPIAVVYTSG